MCPTQYSRQLSRNLCLSLAEYNNKKRQNIHILLINLLFKKCDALLEAYGKQEGRAFNFHFQSNVYYPLVCYDGITGDLIKIQLREGAQYSSTEVVDFLQAV